MTVHLDDLTLQMVHNVRSYSGSDIIIYVPELKFLNVGDIFNKDRFPNITSRTDIPRWLKIFEEFTEKESEIDFVIGGHGELMTMADVREQLDYIRDLWEEIRMAKSRGMELEEIKEKFSFKNFDHLTHINPVNFLTGTNSHERIIENIWKMLD